MNRAALLLLVTGSSACYSPSYTRCAITCPSDEGCPSGYDCVNGFCVAPGEPCGGSGSSDGSVNVDGSVTDSGRVQWSTPTAMAASLFLSPNNSHDDPSMRGDGLELYLNRNESNIIYFTRTTVASAWTAQATPSKLNMHSVNSGDISSDGLEFTLSQAVSSEVDLHFVTRTDEDDPSAWTQQQQVAQLSTVGIDDVAPGLSNNHLVIVFASDRVGGGGGGGDLFMASRNTPKTAAWGAVSALASLNTSAREDSPYLSDDQLTIYFARAGAGTGMDLYQATRASVSSPFGTPEPLVELNTTADENDPWVSADGTLLLFARTDGNNRYQLFQSTR